MLLANSPLWAVILWLTYCVRFATCQTDSCQDACSNYNSILENCNSDASQESVYDSCVCNSDNFAAYVDQCIACEGTASKPAEFKQSCKSVPPDCTVACQGFGLILQGCGSTSSPGFGGCVCSGAYDENNGNTFNQDFQDCVACENGGGNAAFWEAYCCKSTSNCVGMSSQASAALVSIAISSTATQGGSGATQTAPSPASSSTKSGIASTYHSSHGLLGLGVITTFFFIVA